MQNIVKLCLFLIINLFGYAGSDIAVVSLVIGSKYKEAVQIGVENKRLYCEMHGYDFICGEEDLDSSRPIPWSKIVLIQKVLKNSDYKWIFWTDADSLVMNLETRLEDFLDEDYNLIIGKDYNGINSGQFFLKNCPWSLELLSNIYNHTECVHHDWWEQKALMLEIEKHPELLSFTKIVPQRLFNTYPLEITGSLYQPYQTGDFILHFPGTKNLHYLSDLFHKYAKEVVCCSEASNLDRYLQKAGFYMSPLHSNINEGYMTESQKRQFNAWLQSHSHIKRIIEIGLNGGHSAENFFQNCPELQQLVSFDIEKHPYTRVAREYLEKKYKEQFVFVPGSSAVSVREYAKKSPNTKYDLIYIDGDHSYQGAVRDILNCKMLADENTVLWIDDYNGLSIKNAVLECQKRGVIQVDNIHDSSDVCGRRVWVEAHYLFK